MGAAASKAQADAFIEGGFPQPARVHGCGTSGGRGVVAPTPVSLDTHTHVHTPCFPPLLNCKQNNKLFVHFPHTVGEIWVKIKSLHERGMNWELGMGNVLTAFVVIEGGRSGL